MNAELGPVAHTRRFDIDALRVGAFLLLIVYHLGMFYVPWGWHVKSTHILSQLELPMGLLNPWRLTLLFVISGIATRFMGAKLAPPTLATERSSRLLIPLVFGILVVVPPQSWAEVVEKTGYTGSFFDFMTRYLAFDQSFGIILPTYNHLWFIAYLWVYTVLAVFLWRFLPALDRLATRMLVGPGLFLVPVAFFGLYRATVFPHWSETHIIWSDLYAHLHYGTAFFIGLLLAKQEEVWAQLARSRHLSLLAVIAIFALGNPLSATWEDQPDWRGQVFAFLREGYAWMVICALFGYARHHIRCGSPLLTTLSEAVFPFYIIHQTAIVVTGHFVSPYRLPVAVEAGVILGATVVSCLATYGLARAVPLLRLPLGLNSKRAAP